MSGIMCIPLDRALWPDFDDGWHYGEHPGDCHPRVEGGCWTTCCAECAGTRVFPCPWLSTVADGLDDDSASCVACKGTGRAVACLAGAA